MINAVVHDQGQGKVLRQIAAQLNNDSKQTDAGNSRISPPTTQNIISMQVRGKAENKHEMLMTFSPSGGTALKNQHDFKKDITAWETVMKVCCGLGLKLDIIIPRRLFHVDSD